MDRESAIKSPVARSSASFPLENSSAVRGLASTKIPTAQGMEMIIVVFTDRPIFDLAPSISPAATSCATAGIIAEAMAVAKAMGMLEMVSAWLEKIPQWE